MSSPALAVAMLVCALAVAAVPLAWGTPPAAGKVDAPANPTAPPSAVKSARQRICCTQITAMCARIEKAGAEPTEAESAMWDRINNRLEITDSAVMAVVNCWSGYEGSRAVKARVFSDKSYRHTIGLIDALLALSEAWPSRCAWLHEKKANLLQQEENHKGALSEYELSVKAIAPVRMDIDLRRLRCLIGDAICGGVHSRKQPCRCGLS